MVRLSVGTAVLAAAAFAGPVVAGPLDHPGASKSLMCTACHGSAGNSRSGSVPILAGMPAPYFKKQIEAYASGRRPSPEMEPYAKQVLALGVDDVAAYFAAQAMQPTPVTSDSSAIQRGRFAAAQCALCHGDVGRGDAAKNVPSLAGQPPGYLAEQMLLFKQDRRSPGDATLAALKALMKTIPDGTIGDLAAYYSSVR